MKDWADLIQALASLLWPTLSFSVVVLFRNEIRGFVDRLRRGKLFGQELELDAVSAVINQAPSASSAVIARLDTSLKSGELRDAINRVISAHPDSELRPAADQVIDVLRRAAAESVKNAFVMIDSTPLLGTRGRHWEEPYSPDLTVRDFLNILWSQMRPYVRAFTYPDGWVLRDANTGKLLKEIGRPWARSQGRIEDHRTLQEVGILPGGAFEVVAGSDPAQALRLLSPKDDSAL